jgi:hypothetical protein
MNVLLQENWLGEFYWLVDQETSGFSLGRRANPVLDLPEAYDQPQLQNSELQNRPKSRPLLCGISPLARHPLKRCFPLLDAPLDRYLVDPPTEMLLSSPSFFHPL